MQEFYIKTYIKPHSTKHEEMYVLKMSMNCVNIGLNWQLTIFFTKHQSKLLVWTASCVAT